jgi:hypothetical protein
MPHVSMANSLNLYRLTDTFRLPLSVLLMNTSQGRESAGINKMRKREIEEFNSTAQAGFCLLFSR